ncbi:MAG: hypothetical protein AABW90_00600 [Nanoarchaeota archaeon]
MWFRKKEASLLPELPESSELPKLPEFNSSSNENIPGLKLTSLPALPEESMNHYAIKQAVSDEGSKLNMQKPAFQTTDFENNSFEASNIGPSFGSRKIFAQPVKMMEFPRTIELPEKLEKTRIGNKVKKIEPVYVRLDKFKASLDAFEDIRTKIVELEELLEKIKNVKEKEEKELEEWEREIQILKSRIDAVGNSVFKQLGE